MALSTDSGFIASPNYPGPFPSGSNCSYKIQLPANKVLALGWLSFNLRPSLPNRCQDYIEVYDKHLSESNKVFRYCQSGYNPPQFTSSGNVAYLRFVSSSLKNYRYTGFIAYYQSGN